MPLQIFSLPRFKQRYTIVSTPVGNDPKMELLAALDLAKIATTVLFVASAVDEYTKNERIEVLDDWGENIIQSLMSQGMATPIMAVTDLDEIPMKVRQIFIWRFLK